MYGLLGAVASTFAWLAIILVAVFASGPHMTSGWGYVMVVAVFAPGLLVVGHLGAVYAGVWVALDPGDADPARAALAGRLAAVAAVASSIALPLMFAPWVVGGGEVTAIAASVIAVAGPVTFAAALVVRARARPRRNPPAQEQDPDRG